MTVRWRGVPAVCILACLSLLSLLSRAHPAPEVAVPAADLNQGAPLDGAIVFSFVKYRDPDSSRPLYRSFCGILHLRERAVTELPAQPLVFDPEGKWVLGHGGQPICLLTEDGLHTYAPPPAGAAGVVFDALDSSHIFRGDDGTVIGGTQPTLDDGMYDFWTFSTDPDAPDAERWAGNPAPFRGDWAFGSSPTEVYVERDGRIFRGELGWEERHYRHVVRGFCPAVSPDGRLAYTDADRRTIWVRPPNGHAVIYPLREIPGHVVDIQWAPAGVADALLYRCERVREGSDGSATGTDTDVNILDLSSGRHITVFPGDYPGLRKELFGVGNVVGAQWIADIPPSIRNRIAAAVEPEKPQGWPQPVRVCRACRALAREFAAEYGFGGLDAVPHGSSSFLFQRPNETSLHVGVSHLLHMVAQAQAGPKLPASPTTWLPRQHLEAHAHGLLRRMLQSGPWDLTTRLDSYREDFRSGRAELSYSLFASVGDIAFELPATASIWLRGESGQPAPATLLRLEQIEPRLAELPTPKARDGAIRAAAVQMGRPSDSLVMAPYIRAEVHDLKQTPQGKAWDGVIVTRQPGTGLHGKGRHYARVRFAGGDAFTVAVKNAGYTDPVPGLDDVGSGAPALADLSGVEPERGRAIECTRPMNPVWGPDGDVLLFVSGREPTGGDDWQQGPGVMRLDLSTGDIKCLDPGRAGVRPWAVALVGKSTLMSREAGLLFMLDLNTGQITRHRYPPSDRVQVGFFQGYVGLPTVSPSGRHFAYVMRADAGEAGLYVGPMPGGGGATPQATRVSDAYNWVQPTFSRDGSRLYFGRPWPADSADRSGNSGNCSIFRYDFPDPDITKGTLTEISGGINGVEFLHEMPDGRLLINESSGLSLLDIDAGVAGKAKVVLATSPRGPIGNALRTSAIAVSHDGRRIAFSMTPGPDPNSRALYVCDIDGGNLQCVTPPMPILVKPYIFPASGKSALDVWFAFDT